MRRAWTFCLAVLVVPTSAIAGQTFQWLPVADSVTDYSSQQNENGWWYLWSTSPQGPREQMLYLDCLPYVWNEGWTNSCGSYCFQTADLAHANSTLHCSGSKFGIGMPVRQWAAPHDGHYQITFRFQHTLKNVPPPVDGVRVHGFIGNQPTWTSTSVPVNGTVNHDDSFTISQALLAGSTIELVSDSIEGCHSDQHVVTIHVDSLDCDGDGTPDHEQILAGFMNDSDGNWIPDCCEAEVPCNDCEGDVVPDGIVDVQDINAILDNWGSTDAAIDADGSGSVEVNDILLVLHRWGLCTEP